MERSSLAGFIGSIPGRWQGLPTNFRWFIIGLSLTSVAGGVIGPAFNNYLRDAFDMSAGARGRLEFPREMPGFLVAMTSGLLFFLPEVRTAGVAIAAQVVGMLGLAWAGANYGVMVFFLVFLSAGEHLMMPMRSSIILSFSKEGRQASLLGRIGSITTSAGILGAAFGWWFFAKYGASLATYRTAFLIGAGAATLATLAVWRMRLPESHETQPRAKIVFNWDYRVYYALSILFGARKQIFITFAPWVLITVFHRGPSTFAAIAVAAAAIGILWQPMVGWLIDKFGERTVLMADGLLLVAVCMAYGFAHRIGTDGWVLAIVYTAYVLDQLLFAVGMARTTYVQKIAQRSEDVTATLSLGVTLDHVVSMSIPILGGAAWMAFGFEYVFVGAAVLALMSSVVAVFVKLPEAPGSSTTPDTVDAVEVEEAGELQPKTVQI
jgi:predicted MFS family arabinose efflux permease